MKQIYNYRPINLKNSHTSSNSIKAFWLGIFMLLLSFVSVEVRGQMYIVTSTASGNFQRYDFTPNTFATLAPVTNQNSSNLAVAGVGNYIYASQVNGTFVRQYNIATNTWITLPATANISSPPAIHFFTDGTSLYHKSIAQGTAADIYKFDATANTWSAVTAVGTTAFMTFSGVGCIYYTTSMATSGKIRKYDPVTNTTSEIGAIPVSLTALNTGRCADASNIYIVSSGSDLYRVNIATGVSTTLASNASTVSNGLVSDGTNLYGKSGTSIYKYTSSSNTWSTVTTTALTGSFSAATLPGSYYVPVAPVCAAPVITASATQATCTGTTANSNGTITLATFDANAKKVEYNIGSTYSGTGFASATTITGTSNFSVVSTLPNPTVNQPYTLRIYCDASTYIDQTVLLLAKQCAVANLSVSVSPATQTGNGGEYLTYTVTLNNAGPNPATNVLVSVPMPEPTATLLSATAAAGTYNSVSKEWAVPNLAVGSTTLTFTVKIN